MRTLVMTVGIVSCLAAGTAFAADKAEIAAQIDAARAAVEGFAAKAKNHEAVVADVEAARSLVKRAAEALEKGKAMFGLGGVRPEAEQDIRHYTTMADLNISLAEYHLAKVRSSQELATINGQLEKIQTRVKVFEERKAAIEKLRADSVKLEAVSKELAALKTDKALLVSQVEMLMAEKKQAEALKTEKGELDRQLRELREENLRLAGQLEKLTGQRAVTAAKPDTLPKPAVPGDLRQPGGGDTGKPAEVPRASEKGENPLAELIAPENGAKKDAVPVKPAPKIPKPAKTALPVLHKKGAGTGGEQAPLNELVAPVPEKPAAPAAETPVSAAPTETAPPAGEVPPPVTEPSAEK